MSQKRETSPPIIIDISKREPMDIVKDVLENYKKELEKDISSGSSYRKIHEIFASILDSAEAQPNQQAIKFLKTQLPKVYILVQYQRARELIKGNLEKILLDAIDKLTKANENNVKDLIRNARLLIDSIAVIAKEKE